MECKITGKCIMCKHKEVLTPEQMQRARDLGCAFCNKCGNPMVVVKAQVKAKKSKQKA